MTTLNALHCDKKGKLKTFWCMEKIFKDKQRITHSIVYKHCVTQGGIIRSFMIVSLAGMIRGYLHDAIK